MRKLIFVMITTLSFLALSLMTKAESTYESPYSGATHTYNVTVANNMDYLFYVMTTADTTYSNAVVEGTSTYTFDATNTESGNTGGSGTTASVTVTWNKAAASGTDYYLVVRVKGADGCPNYRILPIDIIDNTTDFEVLAIGTGTATAPTDWQTTTTGNSDDCTVFTNENFGDAGPYNLGNTYVYFIVKRSGGNDDSNWTFTFDVDPSNTNVSNTVTYYTYDDDATSTSTASTFTLGNPLTITSSDAASVNNVLIRLTVTNVAGVLNTIDGNIGVNGDSSTAFEVTGNIPDVDNDDVEADFDISIIPAIGSFGGN